MPSLWAPLQLDFGLGFGAAERAQQTTASRDVRFGGAGVSATLSQRHQRGHARAFISAGACVLRGGRAAARAVCGHDGMRRDDLWRRSPRQAGVGCGRQGHRVRHRAAQWAGQGAANPRAQPGGCDARDPGPHSGRFALYTDKWQAYATLKLRGEHVMIRKEKGRPVGRDHINGIEGFWSYAKNWLYPYRGVPRQYFHLYLGEVCYRFNHRGQDLLPLLSNLMRRLSIQEINPILVRKA